MFDGALLPSTLGMDADPSMPPPHVPMPTFEDALRTVLEEIAPEILENGEEVVDVVVPHQLVQMIQELREEQQRTHETLKRLIEIIAA